MNRKIAVFAAFVIGASLPAAAHARTLVQGVVTYVDSTWDADGAVGSGTCAMFQLADGRQFAIFPVSSPQGQIAYQTVLAARVSGKQLGFWDEGPIANAACHFDGGNQPLHYIYAPGF